MTCAVLVPAGQDRARQARPGARARRAAAAGRGQLRRLPDAGPRPRPTHYPVALVNSVNPVRIEGQKTAAFEIVDALGDAPDIHCLPVGNAGNITAYWKGYREYAADGLPRGCPGCGASRPRAPRRSCCGAPVDAPGHHRHRDPDRQPGVVEPARSRPATSPAACIDAVTDRADPATRTGCSRPARACSSSRPRAASVAGLLQCHAAGAARPRPDRSSAPSPGTGSRTPRLALSPAHPIAARPSRSTPRRRPAALGLAAEASAMTTGARTRGPRAGARPRSANLGPGFDALRPGARRCTTTSSRR